MEESKIRDRARLGAFISGGSISSSICYLLLVWQFN